MKSTKKLLCFVLAIAVMVGSMGLVSTVASNSGDTGGLVLDDFKTWDTQKYNFVKEVLWQQDGKFVGLDHEVPLGNNGISLSEAK